MTRYIKNKDGKFAGSIGDGKTKVPTAIEHPSFDEDSIDDELAAIGLGSYVTAYFDSQPTAATTYAEGESLLDAMDKHNDNISEDLANWLQPRDESLSVEEVEELWLSQGAAVSAVRDKLTVATRLLRSVGTDHTADHVEHRHRAEIQASAYGVMTQSSVLAERMQKMDQSNPAVQSAMDAYISAANLYLRPEYSNGVKNIHTIEDSDRAQLVAYVSTARLYNKEAESLLSEINDPQPLRLPQGAGTLISATAMSVEVDVTRGELLRIKDSGFSDRDERVSRALEHIRQAHALHYNLPWQS